MEIAVFTSEDTGGIPFYAPGHIDIVSDISGIWLSVKKIPFAPFTISMNTMLPEIHRRMQSLVSELGDCRIFVSPEIRGIPFAILDSEGFSIWKLEGEPDQLFNYIRKTMSDRLASKTCGPCSCGSRGVRVDLPKPEATEQTGEFFIDLKKILDDDDSLNSKEILIPFIQSEAFEKLSIVCDHTPKWLEKDYELFNLLLEETHRAEGACITVLRPDPSKKNKSWIPYPLGGCGGGGKRRSSCFEG